MSKTKAEDIKKEKKKFKPEDRDGGFPAKTPYFKRRFFEMLPGLYVWTLILMPIVFAIFKLETALVIYLCFLTVYWLYRTIKFVVGCFIGLKRMKKSEETDWVQKIKELNIKRADKIDFIYLCPVYSESLDVLDPSFREWSKSDIGAERIHVVVAMEEKKQDIQLENFKQLEKKYGKKFGSMRYYIHPAGIEGEVAGVKGANINWACRHLVQDLEKEGKNIHDYLLITCDSDLRPHKRYLSNVLHDYLTTENADETFFTSAIHTFNNNIWQVPPLIRNQSNMLTLVILYQWVLEKHLNIPFVGENIQSKETFSSYIVNLETLRKLKFWDPEIPNDDTAFYWNSMVRSKGTFRGEAVYVRTFNDAVENESFWKTHVSFYKQQYRWGWGIVTYPITLSSLYDESSKGFPFYRKFAMIKMMMEYLWFLTVVFSISFAQTFMSLINEDYQYSVYSYNISKVISYIFTFVMLSNVAILYFRAKITPSPKNWKWWNWILNFGETFLIVINMLTFSFIPYIQAVTEMMLGLSKFKRNFYVTEKVRMKDKSKV